MHIRNAIKNNIKPFSIGFLIPIVLGITYAFTIKHSVPCIWCNQTAEEKTCIEMYYGHQNIIHSRSRSGKFCFSEMCDALSVLGGSFKDFSPSNQVEIHNLKELKN